MTIMDLRIETILLSMFFTVLLVNGSEALKCHGCKYDYNPQGVGEKCMTDIASYPQKAQINCTGGCVTYRQHIKGDPNVRSFERRCPLPDDKEGCKTDVHFDTCVKTCNTDLCNNDQGNIPTQPPTTTPKLTTIPDEFIWCYSCSYQYSSAPSVDYECVDQPWNVTIGQNPVRCTKKCVTFRQHLNGDTTVRSFQRTCSDTYENKCVLEADSHFDTCTTSCSSDLCNGGDGKPRPDSTNSATTLVGTTLVSPCIVMISVLSTWWD